MSSYLVLREGDNRNRCRDGQVCPYVGQGIMAPWARRPGCVLVCYSANRTREAERDFCDLLIRRDEGRIVDTPLVFKRVFVFRRRENWREESCPEEKGIKPALDGESMREEPWLERTGRERQRKGLSPMSLKVWVAPPWGAR
ncbi:hypothetical protein TNCV_3754161 [Trichonephila clavipes]|nr:hypothetical protein TNCV_3754161 [Trichonephila clavipes]